MTTPLVVGDHIYGIGSHGQVRGLLAEGKTTGCWSAEVAETTGLHSVMTTPLVVGDHIYGIGSHGLLAETGGSGKRKG